MNLCECQRTLIHALPWLGPISLVVLAIYVNVRRSR